MKAIVVEEFGSIENMKLTDVEMPLLHSKQILIRVKTTSVNYADIKARQGNKGRGNLPFILGLEAAGVIEKGRRGSEVFYYWPARIGFSASRLLCRICSCR